MLGSTGTWLSVGTFEGLNNLLAAEPLVFGGEVPTEDPENSRGAENYTGLLGELANRNNEVGESNIQS